MLNSHGSPANLVLGNGFVRANVEEFARLRGQVDVIWIVGCNVADTETPGTYSDGNLFCSALAKAAECKLVAPVSSQYDFGFGVRTYPPDRIDNFEGLVRTYGPLGNVLEYKTYSSLNRFE